MKKFCPRCGSEDIDMVAGGITGTWMCRKCGFSGSMFPEKPMVLESKSKKKTNEIRKK